MNDWASQAGHYYSREGEPRYEITGANGKIRPTTLRDAKKHGYLPSVTTICKVVAAAPGLESWKIDQAVMAALTGTRRDGESDSDFIARIKREAKEQAFKAAEFGTTVHGQIERHYRGEPVDPAYRLFVDGVVAEVDRYFPGFTWEAERSFAHNGYGGKVDLHGSHAGAYVVIDFKGKDGDLEEVETYPEHWMQLAAYGAGLFPHAPWDKIVTANCFFSRTHPGNAMMVVHPHETFQKGMDMFKAAKSLWCAMKGYET